MKTLLGFCVTLAFIAMPAALVLNPMMMKDLGPTITGVDGQETAEVGELCRFIADGDKVEWECLPKTDDSESYGEKNENYVVSFREPGEYNIITAIYTAGELEIITQTVTVDGPVEPEDPEPVVVEEYDRVLVNKVVKWVKKYQVEAEVCTALADNFETVATRVEAGELSTAGDIIRATAALNADLTLNEGLMAEMQAYLTSQSDMGTLKTPEQHVIVWRSIAKGLKDAEL